MPDQNSKPQSHNQQPEQVQERRTPLMPLDLEGPTLEDQMAQHWNEANDYAGDYDAQGE